MWGHKKNRKEKLACLWDRVKEYYKTFKAPSQIQKLTEEMVKAEKKCPKLKTKGAETRHLVPLGLQLAQEMCEKKATTHNQTLLQAMSHMMDFYMAMSLDTFDPELAARSSRGCLECYGALSREAIKQGKLMWKLKPKMHMFQELAEYQVYELGNPAEFWNYKDEDYMGFISDLAFRRGGHVNPATTTLQVLNRMRVLMSDPDIMQA